MEVFRFTSSWNMCWGQLHGIVEMFTIPYEPCMSFGHPHYETEDLHRHRTSELYLHRVARVPRLPSVVEGCAAGDEFIVWIFMAEECVLNWLAYAQEIYGKGIEYSAEVCKTWSHHPKTPCSVTAFIISCTIHLAVLGWVIVLSWSIILYLTIWWQACSHRLCLWNGRPAL